MWRNCLGESNMVDMKDSGFSWIGMIPHDWKCERGKYILKYMQKPVKENDSIITCFRDGEVTLRSNRREDGFTMADKEIGYQGIDVGDLVVHGMDGFAGAIGISDSRGKASPVLNVLDTKQNKKYIMYFLRSMAYNNVFLSLATGIRVRSCDLRWNKLAELYYPIPSLDEQERIAIFLDTKCSEIDALTIDIQAEIDTLEEYKRSVIMEKVTKGLEPNVEMKNSGIEWVGEIPYDWNKIKIKYATIEIKKGISPDYTEVEKTKIINQATFSKGFFDIENIRFANDDFSKSKGKVQKNDVLLATTGGGVLGKTYYFDEEGEFLASTDVAYLRVDTSKLLAKFLYYCLTINYIMFNDLMANGSTNQTHFDMPSLYNMFLPLPNIKTQNVIIDYLDKKCLEIEDIITKKKQQLEILNQYKKSMIYEYVTGKKEVV